jgi:hypothetical protein
MDEYCRLSIAKDGVMQVVVASHNDRFNREIKTNFPDSSLFET